MAKKRTSGTSKSEAVRELLFAHPDLSAKDIAAKAGVTTSLVYVLKAQTKAKARKSREQKVMATAANGTLDIAFLIDVKKLAERAGGMKKLKEVVDVLAE